MHTAGGGGLFTSTNPELRRVTPDVKGRTKIKLVYVVLEAQYQSALTQSIKNINATRDNVCVEIVGYLLEELRDPSNLAAFTKDMSDANIFIGSLIFIEELADKVCQLPSINSMTQCHPVRSHYCAYTLGSSSCYMTR